MEAGPQNNRIAFVIQARMRSERLPAKILSPLPIAKGKPLLLWIVEELRKSSVGGDIVVATSRNKENDLLQDFCEKQGIECFRGDENDVLSRFIGILENTEYDTLVRLTADNPVIDIEVLDRTISHHLANDNGYTKTEGLPLGMNFEVIKGNVLLSLKNERLTVADKEHVTLFIRNSDKFKKGLFSPKIDQSLKELRLTVDYPSDLLVVSTLFSFCQDNPELKGLKLVGEVFKLYPLLFEANKGNTQKEQFLKVEDELYHAIAILKGLELNRVADILSSYEKETSL